MLNHCGVMESDSSALCRLYTDLSAYSAVINKRVWYDLSLNFWAGFVGFRHAGALLCRRFPCIISQKQPTHSIRASAGYTYIPSFEPLMLWSPQPHSMCHSELDYYPRLGGVVVGKVADKKQNKTKTGTKRLLSSCEESRNRFPSAPSQSFRPVSLCPDASALFCTFFVHQLTKSSNKYNITHKLCC